MYPTADPRRVLSPNAADELFPAREPQFFEFGATEPSTVSANGSPSWLVRSQNVVVEYSEVRVGDTLDCSSSSEEVAVLLLDAAATLVWRSPDAATDATIELAPNTFTVVPSGSASLAVCAAGQLVRVYSAADPRLAAKCLNASYYANDDPNIPPFVPWSNAASGAIPVSFDFGSVAQDPGRFGRIYRSDAAMVNVFYPHRGPRDPAALSPHAHAHFDQVSLQLRGNFVHHVRTTWGPDSGAWRADEHRLCSGPALAIFPPPLIHTSQATGDGQHQLVDIFGPPRADFAAQPGWLLNGNGEADG